MYFKLAIILSILVVFSVRSEAQTPSEAENEILTLLSTISKYGNYGGEYDDAKLYSANDVLLKRLTSYGTRADILEYSFPRLREAMSIATSKDGRLRIYSWDMQTGGTMHDHESVFQFKGKSGKIATWTDSEDDESAGSFYSEIFQLDTRRGPIYLATSTFIGSTSMHGQSINAIRLNGDGLDPNAKLIRTSKGLTDSISFGYDFFSVVDRPERPIKLFEFDERKKEFRFPVVIEDEETQLGRVTNRWITYRFNGRHFVKVN